MSEENILKGELQRAQTHPYQKKNHFPDLTNNNNEEELASEFWPEHWMDDAKVAWHGTISKKLQELPHKQTMCNYTCDSDHYHNLIYVSVKQQFPSISVHETFRDKIRISYKDCPAIRSIDTTSLVLNNDEFTMDQTSIYMMFHCFHYEPEKFARLLGNHMATGFHSSLPEFETNMPLPWSYGKHRTMSLPLYRKLTVTHKIKIVDDFSSLLRMQKLDETGIWRETKFDWSYIDSKKALEMPQMRGRYSRQAENEIKTFGCIANASYIIEKISCIPFENTVPYDGKTISIPLFQMGLCRAILFVIEDAHGNIVNSEGEPWHEHYSILYGTEYRVQEYTEMDNELEFIKHFPSTPTVRGISGYSFIHDQNSLPPTMAVTFPQDTFLSIKLKSPKVEEDAKIQLKIKVRLFTEYHLSFSKK